MMSRKSRLWCQIFSVGLMVFLFASPALAEDDPNPDSPTPVLISETDSLRALANAPDKLGTRGLSKIKSPAFEPTRKPCCMSRILI